jgi:hypothetical protein
MAGREERLGVGGNIGKKTNNDRDCVTGLVWREYRKEIPRPYEREYSSSEVISRWYLEH